MGRSLKRLAGPALIDSTPETVYTVPALTKAVIRHIHVSNESDVDASVDIAIGTDGAATRIAGDKNVPANDFIDMYGIYVLTTTEIVQASSSADDVMTITINGEEEVL